MQFSLWCICRNSRYHSPVNQLENLPSVEDWGQTDHITANLSDHSTLLTLTLTNPRELWSCFVTHTHTKWFKRYSGNKQTDKTNQDTFPTITVSNNALQVPLHTLISCTVHKRLWVAKVTGGWTIELKQHVDWFGDARISVRWRLEDNCVLMMYVEAVDVWICFPHHFTIRWLLKEPNVYVICRHTQTDVSEPFLVIV